MTKRFSATLLCWIAVSGGSVHVLAAPAHPRGPEDQPVTERSIRIQGETKAITVTLAYPKPDDGTDWSVNGNYNVLERRPVILSAHFKYQGYFGQGHFGGVVLKIAINTRDQDSPRWKDLPTLLRSVQVQGNKRNDRMKDQIYEARLVWAEPVISQLNGAPCIQQYVALRDHPKNNVRFVFPLDEDNSVELNVEIVDNSDRPGLVQSDWRPRAEVFASRLLSTVKVTYESKD